MGDDRKLRSAEVNRDGSVGDCYHSRIERDNADLSILDRAYWAGRIAALRVGVVGRTLLRVGALVLILQGLWNNYVFSYFEYGTFWVEQRAAIGSTLGAEAIYATFIGDIVVAAIGLFLFKKV